MAEPEDRRWGLRTRAVPAGARPDPATGARAVPIYQTTSFVFEDVEDAADPFALQKYGNIYTRLGNPTVAALEESVASLEGVIGAVARKIAVVGASANPARASNFVLTYLRSSSADYEVWPVTPNETTVLGIPAYPSLAELLGTSTWSTRSVPRSTAAGRRAGGGRRRPGPMDQLGLHSDEVVRIAYEAGLEVVTNRGVKIEHARFHGGLHLAGFDTGVISARRVGVT